MRTKILTISLIMCGIATAGIILFFEIPVSSSNTVIWLSATAETSPGGVKIYSLEQLSNLDKNTIMLDNVTLDKIPTLRDAIDKAFGGYVPPSLCSSNHGCLVSRTFTTQISQSDADSIKELAGDKVSQLSETQTNDTNFGVSFVTDASDMEFKFNNLYYHITIEQLVPA